MNNSDRDIALDAIAKLARCRGELGEVRATIISNETVNLQQIDMVLRKTAAGEDWPEWTSEWHTKADDERPHHE